MATKNAKSEKNVNVDGLENVNKKGATQEVPQFENREWLEENDPKAFHSEEESSPKFDKDSEAEIAKGLEQIEKLAEIGFPLNPLMVLLAKWWEVKSARAAIRKMLTDEAESKGYPKDVYLEKVIGVEQIDVLAALQSAIGRMRYARTFFKPRKGLSTKVITKQVSIDGQIYIVPVQELEKAKADFGKDVAKIKEYVLSVATKFEAEIEEL